MSIKLPYGWAHIPDQPTKMRHHGTGEVKTIPAQVMYEAFYGSLNLSPEEQAEAALRDAEAEMKAEWDAAPVVPAYGVRLILSNERDEVGAVILPMVFTDPGEALRLSHLITHSPNTPFIMAYWLENNMLTMPDGEIWQPLATRVVRLVPEIVR